MYLAHINEDRKRVQPLIEHLENVANLAGIFAESFHCYDWGYGCGYLHDCGKGSKAFLKRLNGGDKVDHSTAGAKELYLRNNILAAYCVAGHHSGLLNGGSCGDTGEEKTLHGRMKKELSDYQDFLNYLQHPEFSKPPLTQFEEGGFSASFFVRMVFSCLIDADRLDTESFMKKENIRIISYDSMDELLNKLMEYIQPWLINGNSSTLNNIRNQVLETCLSKGKSEQGLYQLTIPTGGGKTIASLSFALEHAKKHGLKRIIYVIPYCSIIDQNAQVYREILGDKNVLEDHSNACYDGAEENKALQFACENWDIPVIVTTNVQFFDSLFSNRTSKCRKLHNIASSVVIFDEVQMLPRGYLNPCVHAINELVFNYQCTAVLCTATQPSLQPLFENIWNETATSTSNHYFQISEIYPCTNEIYQALKRSNILYNGKMSVDSLVKKLRLEKQVLCIVNNRRRAQMLYEEIKGECIYHLSTTMCPQHRKRTLKKISEKLKNGEKCHVISTSLCEAGIDLDFNCVYRELAGLDSLIQASGRCNREGRNILSKSNTIVFEFSEIGNMFTPESMKRPISVTREIISDFFDIASPEAIKEYFLRLYHLEGKEGIDLENIIETLNESNVASLPFEDIANRFKMIDNKTLSVFIAKGVGACKVLKEMEKGNYTRQLLRDSSQYCVNLRFNDFKVYQDANLLDDMHNGLYLLKKNVLYSSELGLRLDIKT